jgi:predicted nucleic acid-binding protein
VEILAGMRPTEARGTRALLDHLQWSEVSDPIAERAGELAAAYVRTHPGIEVVDYVIAATALELDGDLWTTNVRHFPMFERLAAPYR